MFDPIRDASPPPSPRTPTGEPWVQWVKHGGFQGWCAPGTRSPKVGSTFWEITFGLAARHAGVAVDQVHAASAGVMALGAFGVTLTSGYAQLLLNTCLVEDPVKFVDVMAPVFHATGAHTKPTEKSPSGMALADEKGSLVMSEAALRQLVLLGSNSVKWTGPQKARARLWVSCASELLRDEQMDRAQVAFASRLLPDLAGEEVRRLIRWPRHGAEETWQYSREHQALWAVCFVRAMQGTMGQQYLVSVIQRAGGNAEPAAMLRELGHMTYKPLVKDAAIESEKNLVLITAAAFGVSHLL